MYDGKDEHCVVQERAHTPCPRHQVPWHRLRMWRGGTRRLHPACVMDSSFGKVCGSVTVSPRAPWSQPEQAPECPAGFGCGIGRQAWMRQVLRAHGKSGSSGGVTVLVGAHHIPTVSGEREAF